MSSADVRALISEEGWPCYRLRAAFSLILFYFFETLVGKQLGTGVALLALGLGLACLVSAFQAIQKWKLKTQLTLVMDAIEKMPRS